MDTLIKIKSGKKATLLGKQAVLELVIANKVVKTVVMHRLPIDVEESFKTQEASKERFEELTKNEIKSGNWT